MSEPTREGPRVQPWLSRHVWTAIPVGSLTLVDIVLSDVYRLVEALLSERTGIPRKGATRVDAWMPRVDLDHLGRGRRGGEPTTRLRRRPVGEGI